MFYERLKNLCDGSGTTISSFVEMMGGSKGSPSNWKRGAIPNSDIVIKAAQFFQVSADYLLGLSDVEGSEQPINEETFVLEPDERAVIEALRAAAPTAKAAALASMYSILGVLSAKNGARTYCSLRAAENDERGAV